MTFSATGQKAFQNLWSPDTLYLQPISPFPFISRIPLWNNCPPPTLCQAINHSLIKISLTVWFNHLAFELDNLAFPSVVYVRLQRPIFGTEKLNIECVFVFTFNLPWGRGCLVELRRGASHNTTKDKKRKKKKNLLLKFHGIA